MFNECTRESHLTIGFQEWGRRTHLLVIWMTSGQQLPPSLVHFCGLGWWMAFLVNKKKERYSDRYMKKLCLQGWRFLKAWRDLLRKSSEYQTLARCRLERWRWQVCEWRLLCRGRQLKVSLDSQQLLRIQTVTRSLVKTSLEISTETSEITPLMFIYAAQYLQFTVLPIIC